MNDDVDMFRYVAGLHARHAAEHFMVAHGTNRFCEVTTRLKMEMATDHLQKAADALGYDLVKREAAKQSEAA